MTHALPPHSLTLFPPADLPQQPAPTSCLAFHQLPLHTHAHTSACTCTHRAMGTQGTTQGTTAGLLPDVGSGMRPRAAGNSTGVGMMREECTSSLSVLLGPGEGSEAVVLTCPVCFSWDRTTSSLVQVPASEKSPLERAGSPSFLFCAHNKLHPLLLSNLSLTCHLFPSAHPGCTCPGLCYEQAGCHTQGATWDQGGAGWGFCTHLRSTVLPKDQQSGTLAG